MLVKVSQLSVDQRDHVVTFEINPLMVLPEGSGCTGNGIGFGNYREINQ